MRPWRDARMDLSYLVGSRGSLAQHVGGPGHRQHGKGAASNIKKKQSRRSRRSERGGASGAGQGATPAKATAAAAGAAAAAGRGAARRAEQGGEAQGHQEGQEGGRARARCGGGARRRRDGGSWDRAFAQADAADGGGGGADDDDEDEQDSDYDEELAEHGSFVPDRVGDPKSAAAAAAAVGRRVYFDGLEKRRDLNGSGAELVAWRGKQWEVECDHGDEHILVPSGVLRWLDQAPPPRSGAAPRRPRRRRRSRSGELVACASIYILAALAPPHASRPIRLTPRPSSSERPSGV